MTTSTLTFKALKDLTGEIKNSPTPFSVEIPPGLVLHRLDGEKGNIHASYFGHKLNLDVDFSSGNIRRGILTILDKDTSSTLINSDISVAEYDDLIMSMSGIVKNIHWEVLRKLLKKFLDKAGRHSMFPKHKGDHKVNYALDKGASLVGFAVGGYDGNEDYLLSKIVIGYNFRKQMFLSRLQINDKSKSFDNENLHEAFYPIIRAVGRKHRGEDPWENVWK